MGDEPSPTGGPAPQVPAVAGEPSQSSTPPLLTADVPDALARQQQLAADNLGLGNVSTLQAYHGSRIVNAGERNFNCMGDEVVCTSVATGARIWARKLEGDLEQLGGHLAAPPVLAEGDLFVATVVGKVLRLSLQDGTVKATYDVGTELRFSPVIVAGRLYVSTQHGRIVCLALR